MMMLICPRAGRVYCASGQSSSPDSPRKKGTARPDSPCGPYFRWRKVGGSDGLAWLGRSGPWQTAPREACGRGNWSGPGVLWDPKGKFRDSRPVLVPDCQRQNGTLACPFRIPGTSWPDSVVDGGPRSSGWPPLRLVRSEEKRGVAGLSPYHRRGLATAGHGLERHPSTTLGRQGSVGVWLVAGCWRRVSEGSSLVWRWSSQPLTLLPWIHALVKKSCGDLPGDGRWCPRGSLVDWEPRDGKTRYMRRYPQSPTRATARKARFFSAPWLEMPFTGQHGQGRMKGRIALAKGWMLIRASFGGTTWSTRTAKGGWCRQNRARRSARAVVEKRPRREDGLVVQRSRRGFELIEEVAPWGRSEGRQEVDEREVREVRRTGGREEGGGRTARRNSSKWQAKSPPSHPTASFCASSSGPAPTGGWHFGGGLVQLLSSCASWIRRRQKSAPEIIPSASIEGKWRRSCWGSVDGHLATGGRARAYWTCSGRAQRRADRMAGFQGGGGTGGH